MLVESVRWTRLYAPRRVRYDGMKEEVRCSQSRGVQDRQE